MKKLYGFAVLTVFFVPVLTLAYSMQTGSEINIQGQTFEENLYLIGGKVSFDNQTEKDLFLVTGEGNINGSFKDDVEALLFRANFKGEYLKDVRLFGGEINLDFKTDGDLFIVGGKVNIAPDAVLNGKTFIVAGEVNINGKVFNDLKIISAKTNINGELNANSNITSQKLNIGDNAIITGNLNYFSSQKAFISNNAKINNEIRFNQIEKISENSVFKKVVLNLIIFWTVIKFLASLFIALILVFVFRVFSQRVSMISNQVPIKSFLVGVLSIFLIPIICVILFASLFAIPVSIILFFVYIILLILTASVSGIIVGFFLKKINNKENKKIEVDFNSATLGIVLLTFLSFIPWLGEILRFILIPLSFGAMMMYYFEIIMKRKVIR